MTVLEIKSKAQFDDLIKTHPHVAIQAHATWCGPCKAISPIFEKHANEFTVPEKFALAKFDTDEVPDLAQELGIRSIPAFFFFSDGEKVDSISGANPPALQKAVTGLHAKATA